MPGGNFAEKMATLGWLIATIPFFVFVFAFIAMPGRSKKIYLFLTAIPLLLYTCGFAIELLAEQPHQFLKHHFGMTEHDCFTYDGWMLRLCLGFVILCPVLLLLGWLRESVFPKSSKGREGDNRRGTD